MNFKQRGHRAQYEANALLIVLRSLGFLLDSVLDQFCLFCLGTCVSVAWRVLKHIEALLKCQYNKNTRTHQHQIFKIIPGAFCVVMGIAVYVVSTVMVRWTFLRKNNSCPGKFRTGDWKNNSKVCGIEIHSVMLFLDVLNTSEFE